MDAALVHHYFGTKDEDALLFDDVLWVRRAREEHDLGWHEWAKRVREYLKHVEMLFSPSLIIIGGGVSKKADKFLPHLHLDTPVIPAELENQAGIVGAARAAARSSGQPDSDSAMSES